MVSGLMHVDELAPAGREPLQELELKLTIGLSSTQPQLATMVQWVRIMMIVYREMSEVILST